jgi:hypothetical protein
MAAKEMQLAAFGMRSMRVCVSTRATLTTLLTAGTSVIKREGKGVMTKQHRLMNMDAEVHINKIIWKHIRILTQSFRTHLFRRTRNFHRARDHELILFIQGYTTLTL